MGGSSGGTEARGGATTIQSSPQGEAQARALLLIVHGPGRGRVVALPEAPEPWRIGRAPSCELSIDDPSLSRVHASVRCVDGEYFLHDEGSKNGTAKNGAPIGYAVLLEEGDRITLGDVRLRFVRAGDLEAKLLSGATGTASAPHASAPQARAGAVRRIVRTPGLAPVFEQAERVARSPLSVLVLGETGVGKEILVESLHEASPRAGKELLSLNCAALTETLLEAELFGSERGSFTGAVAARPGLIESAEGGTLFLDEVGELPLPTQAKLLRVLEDRKVMRVGARKARAIDVRFVAATNQELEARVASGEFRRDLLFRLNAVTLRIPPLRERRGDVLVLARAFLAEACALASAPLRELGPEVERALTAYDWPGNARELRNAIERAVVLGAGSTLSVENLPADVTGGPRSAPTAGRPATPAAPSDADPERERILAALEAHGGNQSATAEALGVSRRTLVSRLSSWGLTKVVRRR